MNYFSLFKIPKNFKIDEKLLSKNFYKLQSQFHPDLFINDSEVKKKIILEKSIQINKGYATLKNFLNRAIYFLFLNGFEIKRETILLENNSFLMKYFSLYEELDDLKKNNFNKKHLDDFIEKIEKKITNYKNEIEMKFENKKYEEVIPIIAKFLFFKKIRDNLKKEYNIFLRRID
ncbi:Fe-S protein assembly co-chaperone HscB [Buchnera aphidicola]|uniref:Co-chaperone protein HscB n=1 Tax=Buchnera aphidicola (Macrosiphum gaurae) TaxID=2315801 RepID=A0A4D6XZY2_9GAMM|nr:Fe-S protein assembly co-chaperone HscB [Buchnera aphidicola]QCI23022.1 Fe-S protein assembly co-chaperone HscB [Buchnera aphidicola (Macrosiphum gaurae)]